MEMVFLMLLFEDKFMSISGSWQAAFYSFVFTFLDRSF